jgi:acetyl esterase
MSTETILPRSDLNRPIIETNTRAFLDALAVAGGVPIEQLSVEEARKQAARLQSGAVATLPADAEDHTIECGPTGTIPIRIIRPKDNKNALPVVMYFHGGGWVLNDRWSFDRLLREIAIEAHVAAVFVEYTRSPEARYPVAIEEAYAATKWIAENGSSLRLDPSRLAVIGDSSGGNMAAVVALMAKERGGPKIDCQVLFSPTVDANFNTNSYRLFATDYFLTREAMKWFWNHYAPDEAAREYPTASPLKASIAQLKELPPALVITGECDPLRDEGEAYARKLMDAGVRVTATRYLGTIHAFVFLNDIKETPAARAAIAQATAMLRTVFAR